MTVRIKTKIVDPVLLNKLAAVYIVPDGEDDFDSKPIGTGVYKVEKFVPGKNAVLQVFDYYWDKLRSPDFERVILMVITDKDERLDAVLDGKVDFLSEVPPGAIETLETIGMTVVTRPSLEVNFLGFNTHSNRDDNIFADRRIRQAVAYAIEEEKLSDFTKEFGHSASQFVSRGVFGFNPDLKRTPYNMEKAIELVRETNSFTRLKATLDLMKGLEILGDYLTDQFFRIGIDLEVDYLELPELEKKVGSGESIFYFLGWRAELADASDFYKLVVHTPTEDGLFGTYNAGYFSNQEIDSMIEQSEKVFSSEDRLKTLREIMRKLVEDEIFGIPLFEPELIFAYKKGLSWTPRFDGYVVPSQIKRSSIGSRSSDQ